MSDYKVTYFDFAGSRGEELRLALVLTGQPFEDIRLSRDQFLSVKPDLPFAVVPTLDVAGKGVFGQTNALLRLIARRHGLYPEDLFEAARHDALMDAVEDLRHRISPTMRMPDGPEKLAARAQLAAEFLPLWGRCVDRMIGAGPFVGGDRIGVADLKIYMADRWIATGALDGIPGDVLDGFPALKRVAAAVGAHPAITAWYA